VASIKQLATKLKSQCAKPQDLAGLVAVYMLRLAWSYESRKLLVAIIHSSHVQGLQFSLLISGSLVAVFELRRSCFCPLEYLTL
jgi:hypothetical protein